LPVLKRKLKEEKIENHTNSEEKWE
jgi:hypothetical protein